MSANGSLKVNNYGRIEPMLKSLEELVRCESPTEDLDACNEVMRVANAIAIEVLGVPARTKARARASVG